MFYKEMQEILNEGEINKFKLEKYEIGKNKRPVRCNIPAGKYISLVDTKDPFNGCIMSNTPMEKRTNRDILGRAHGDVFIVGLGIGLIVLPIQEKEEVKSITILEKHPEIIELVGKQLPLNEKVRIIQGDAFGYQFPKEVRFDCIYFDIWNYVNSDIYKEMKELKKRFRKHLRSKKENPHVYMACWAEWWAKNNRPLI